MAKRTASSKATEESHKILNDLRHLVQNIRVSSLDSEKRIGLSAAQLLVLQRLSESGELSVNDLAKRTMTHQSSVSVVVQKLETQGFVKRKISKEDRRAFKISPTKKGLNILKKAPAPVHDTLIEALNTLDPKVRRNLAQGFTAFLQRASINTASPAVFIFLPKILKRVITIISGLAS